MLPLSPARSLARRGASRPERRVPWPRAGAASPVRPSSRPRRTWSEPRGAAARGNRLLHAASPTAVQSGWFFQSPRPGPALRDSQGRGGRRGGTGAGAGLRGAREGAPERARAGLEGERASPPGCHPPSRSRTLRSPGRVWGPVSPDKHPRPAPPGGHRRAPAAAGARRPPVASRTRKAARLVPGYKCFGRGCVSPEHAGLQQKTRGRYTSGAFLK